MLAGNLPCSLDLSIDCLTAWHLILSKCQKARESQRVTVFCSLITGVTLHHFCCIPFARSRLLRSVHT